MAYVHIGEIVRLFGDEHKTVTKGENALNSNHIINVTVKTSHNHYHSRGVVASATDLERAG